ncbi:hypothetical protein L9F63_003780, partial [Diploptera punctata]
VYILTFRQDMPENVSIIKAILYNILTYLKGRKSVSPAVNFVLILANRMLNI